jgi:hypothetical protein
MDEINARVFTFKLKVANFNTDIISNLTFVKNELANELEC